MENKITELLYNAYSSGKFEDITPADTEDLAEEQALLKELEEKYNFTFEDICRLEDDLLDRMIEKHAYRSFCGGFTLAVRLMKL